MHINHKLHIINQKVIGCKTNNMKKEVRDKTFCCIYSMVEGFSHIDWYLKS